MALSFVAQKDDVYSGLGEDDNNCDASNASWEKHAQEATLEEKEENTHTAEGGRGLGNCVSKQKDGTQASEESDSDGKPCKSVDLKDDKVGDHDRCSWILLGYIVPALLVHKFPLLDTSVA